MDSKAPVALRLRLVCGRELFFEVPSVWLPQKGLFYFKLDV